MIMKIVNYNCKIKLDLTKPDGIKRKLIDSSLIKKLGWNHTISLNEGIKDLYFNHFNRLKNYILLLFCQVPCNDKVG